MDVFQETPTREMPSTRSVPTSNGNKYNITRTDPYGLWYVSMERGQIPDSLKGAYTTYEYAKRAVDAYIQQKKKD